MSCDGNAHRDDGDLVGWVTLPTVAAWAPVNEKNIDSSAVINSSRRRTATPDRAEGDDVGVEHRRDRRSP